MKKVILPIVFVFLCFQGFSQIIDWSAVRQRYIDKYQPQKVPAWLFPMIFQEGNGGRDTLYMGYDSLASVNYDAAFAEALEAVDTSKFYAYFSDCCFGIPDTVLKVSVDGYDSYPYIGVSILFYNGILPIKIYWDVSQFRSDSLPYPDLDPAPRAQGLIGCDLPMTTWSDSTHTSYCPFDVAKLITDSTLDNPCGCCFKDSILFFDIYGGVNTPIGVLGYGVFPWIGKIPIGINDVANQSDVYRILPNPASDIVYLITSASQACDWVIHDLSGQILFNGRAAPLNSTSVNVSELSNGIYFITVRSKNFVQSLKFFVVH